MTKTDLIAAVADRAGLTRADAERAVNATVDSICDALAGGDKVTLVGFGTFSVGERAARKGRNPQTGATIDIPASKSAKFKPSKSLKDAL
jgi:DNA-binding protein HU-beta